MIEREVVLFLSYAWGFASIFCPIDPKQIWTVVVDIDFIIITTHPPTK